MDQWKQYLLSVIICAFSCGIVSKIVSDTKGKELIRLVCGMVLAISVIRPLSRINPADFLQIPAGRWSAADPYISEGEKVASQAQARCIKASCETYILDKAKELGVEIRVDISLNENSIPTFAEITGEADHHVQSQLQSILTMDLGIPKENQKWIWNLESNS